eukprot:scaffold22031_cov18-Prasinocladus_malaysianus.AAC.1
MGTYGIFTPLAYLGLLASDRNCYYDYEYDLYVQFRRRKPKHKFPLDARSLLIWVVAIYIAI